MTRKFCVMTIGRTGSTSLMDSLEQCKDIAVPNKNVECPDNELVRPNHVGRLMDAYAELCKKPITTQQQLIEAFYEQNDDYAYAGFKSMPDRHKDYDTFIKREDIQFITLGRRDIPSMAASFMNANDAGTWRRYGGDTPAMRDFDVKRDGGRLRSHVIYIFRNYWQLSKVPNAIKLFYEDLCESDYSSKELDEFFNRLVKFENPKPPTHGSSYISNWDEFRDFVGEVWRYCADKSGQKKGATRPASSLPVIATTNTGQGPVKTKAGAFARGQKRKIMYVWELGMDLGHIMRFLPLAFKLRDRGYEITFTIRELTRAESAIGIYGFPVVQAPIWMSGTKHFTGATLNYTDIIRRYGFRDAVELKGLVKAWRQLYQYAGAEMVIADHSPSAILAARTMGLKCITIGTGFCIPPHTNPMPNMRSWVDIPQEKLAKIDNEVADLCNQVIADLGGKPLQSLSELFKVDEEFITAFKELDHYPNRGKTRYWGPGFNVDEGIALEWPEGKGPKIFAYLKPAFRDFEPVLKALQQLPVRVLAYTPAIPAKLQEQYQSDKFIISQKPLKLSSILKGCDLVICHAGNGTVAATLLAGVPLLLLPTQLEQTLLSRRVVEIGAGLLADASARKDSQAKGAASEKNTKDNKSKDVKAPDYRIPLQKLLKTRDYQVAARKLAKKYSNFNQAKQISAMATRVEEILAGRTSR